MALHPLPEVSISLIKSSSALPPKAHKRMPGRNPSAFMEPQGKKVGTAPKPGNALAHHPGSD